MISILILTLNEQDNLPDCLQSVSGFDDVVVLDSFSSDQTVELARAAGASVVERKFDNWAAHQNWAMANIPFKHRWVFYLDADERMTPELEAEIRRIAAISADGPVAYYVGRRNFFMGGWIRHAFPPGMIMRFFIPARIRFERLVNPIPVVDGPVGYLSGQLLHYNFSKGLEEWVAKHNRYSTQEAQQNLIELGQGAMDWSGLVQFRDPARRRRALKQLSIRMPGRSVLRFLYMYVLNLGFLDGRAGFTYCRLVAWYEGMIALKLRELRLKAKDVRL